MIKCFKHLHTTGLFLFTVLPFISFSQIQGSAVDEKNQPLAFANIILLNASDSTTVTGVMATEEGTFSFSSFKPGKYTIAVSIIGFKKAFSSPFEITDSKEHKHIEPIVAISENQLISDVEVIAKKPIYELKIDRMIVNVENSITSSGNTALQVLEKSPGVIVDRQNLGLSLSGKNGVVVMINGKDTRMPIAAAIQMLDAMNADNVKRIEIITAPPSKYNAEGDGGMINIVLKKNEAFGTNGSFTLGAGYGEREKFNGSFNINHHTEKVNYFGSYSATFNNSRTQIDSYRKYIQDGNTLETTSFSDRSAIESFQNIRMGLDYTLTSKTTLSILGTGFVRDWDMDAINNIEYLKNSSLTSTSAMNVTELNKWIHGMGNINLIHHFEEEKVLDFNFDYLNYFNDNPSYYTIENKNQSGQQLTGEEIDVTKTTPLNILVGTLDYSNQVNEKIKIETGIKGTVTFFKNDVGVKYFDNGIWVTDPELTNIYTMDENIMAAYGTVNYNLGKNTSIIAGLRYEYMNSVLDSETEKGIVDLHYGELFPNIYFSQKINDKNTLQLSYSRRITRPTFNELAPFIIFVTPEIYVAGNENLLPAISSIYKTDYQFKSIMLTLIYTNTKNGISRFQPKYNEDGTKQYFVSQNLDNTDNFSAMLAFPVTVSKWWKMQNNFNWVYQHISTLYEGINIDNKMNNYRINSIQSLTLAKNFTAEFTGVYQSKSLNGVYETLPFGKLDIGVQYKLKNGNSRFDLNVTDVFKTFIFRSTANIPELNIYNKWQLDFEPRIIRLSFTHNFGSNAIKQAARKSASSEEQERIGR